VRAQTGESIERRVVGRAIAIEDPMRTIPRPFPRSHLIGRLAERKSLAWAKTLALSRSWWLVPAAAGSGLRECVNAMKSAGMSSIPGGSADRTVLAWCRLTQ